jgi:hydroxymethylglutaryl-CoA synthase
MTKAGISDITISIPRLYVPLANRDKPDEPTEFSLSRKTDPKKYLYGLGVAKMAIPDTYQDSVTLAANAIYELIERNDISPEDIQRIEIGTETSPDKSKSIANYVIGALEKKLGKRSLKHCAPPESKAACASTAYALENALDWVWAGRSKGKCRIICGTDIARYELYSPGEPTQGAAAVAILVEENPRLLEFDKIVGHCNEDEDSFYRPDFSHVAIVDGKKSEKMYLSAMREAFDHYAQQAIESGLVDLKPGEALTDHYYLISFHQPYPKMVKKAFASLLIHEYRELPRWKNIVEEIGEEPKRPVRENFDSEVDYEVERERYETERKKFLKKFMKTKIFQDEFQAKVADGQEASIEMGNSYTASVWSHLLSLLILKDKKGEDLTGKRGGIGFFGSGCVAVAQSYTVVPGYEKVVRSFNLFEKLNNRIAISLEDYEALHEGEQLSGGREYVLPPEHEFRLTEIKRGYRYYDFVE